MFPIKPLTGAPKRDAPVFYVPAHIYARRQKVIPFCSAPMRRAPEGAAL